MNVLSVTDVAYNFVIAMITANIDINNIMVTVSIILCTKILIYLTIFITYSAVTNDHKILGILCALTHNFTLVITISSHINSHICY